MVLAGIGTASHAGAQAPVHLTPRSTVIVVPFDSAGRDPRDYRLREASAVIVTDDLVSLGILAMSRDERLRAFETLRVPATAPLSHATVIRVGQIVGAVRVIIGSAAISGEMLTARPFDSSRWRTDLAEVVETGLLADLLAVYSRVTQRLAERMPREAPAPATHPPVAAFEQFIKGLLAEAPEMKLSFLRDALRLSPTLERARLEMWAVHNALGEHLNAWPL